MHAVRCQENKNNEVRDQQRHVESIGLIDPLECLIEEVLANVAANAAGSQEQGWHERRSGSDRQLGNP